MCKKLIYLISFILVLSLAVVDVQGAAHIWTDADDDHDWFNSENWDPNMVPTDPPTYNNVAIDLLPGPIIAAVGEAARAVSLRVGYRADGALTIEGGTLLGDGIYMGVYDASQGTFYMNSGFVTQTGHVFALGYMGVGTLEMTGGSMALSQFVIGMNAATAVGHANLYGGIITTTGNFEMGAKGSVGTMDIKSGTLVIDGNFAPLIQGYIDGADPNDPNDDWITAYGGEAMVLLDFNDTNPGKTTLAATPQAIPSS